MIPTSLRAPTRRAQAGFSVMELVIAMVIFGLLVSIAIPSYTRYVARGNRTAIKTFLVDLAQRQESFRSDRGRYAQNYAALGYTGFVDDANGMPMASGTPLTTMVWIDASGVTYNSTIKDKTLYQVNLVANPAANSGATNVRMCAGLTVPPSTAAYGLAWAAIAAPENSQATRDGRCASLCLNGTGRQGASGSDGWQTCWRG